MMTVLLESAAARDPRRTRWAAASFIVHTALVAAAIVLTTQATGDAREPEEPAEPPIFIRMPQEPTVRAPSPSQPRSSIVAPPSSLRINVPAIPTFDPSVPFSPAPLGENEIFGRSVPVDAMRPTSGTVGEGIHSAATVERVASALPGNGQPVYPRTLQRATVEGEVLVQFVVDSSGRVERQSIAIVQATHPLFAAAVRDWLPRTRYAPAEIRGVRVRQLVQQTIGFALHH